MPNNAVAWLLIANVTLASRLKSGQQMSALGH
jgi:hypothetical protein